MIEYTQTELRVIALASAAGTAFSWMVGGIDTPLQYFLVLMVFDYISGMVAAWRTGKLSSTRAFTGIARKVIILGVLVLANVIDGAASLDHVLRGMVLLTYSIMEGMSIIENIDRAGWGKYIPAFLRSKLEKLQEEKGAKLQ